MKSHYFTSPVVKLGIWSLTPGDCETWHGEHTSKYFQQLFGIPKWDLLIYEVKNNFEHAYVEEKYLKLLHSAIDSIKAQGYKELEKKLKTFYPLLHEAKSIVPMVYKDASKLTNQQLAAAFLKIRDRIHHLAIFDQFTWLAEEYWTPKMEDILVTKLKLKKGSVEYNQVLFTLTKPEVISTTLTEKKTVLEKALLVKQKKLPLKEAAQQLTHQFGWLPVFCYGTPWQTDHYEQELQQLQGKGISSLQLEHTTLLQYTKLRNKELQETIKKYKITSEDAQIFIDFGLALDTRNEAEYFVSFAGFYLLPLYQEIAKRLFLSIKQVRILMEQEMIDALLGKANAQMLLDQKGKFIAWGSDKTFQKRVNFNAQESEALFKHIEAYVKPIQGGNEHKGVCASPGKVKGKIRIVPSPQDNHKVQQGDILVTYATTTDYLPAMKRAAAIITEIGGLTCHAAVVSREFGLPCIVALTNAMKNFKDGELVEVDADEGTVKRMVN